MREATQHERSLSGDVNEILVANRPPLISGHNPLHKLIEERHSERRITMGRTPDHSLGDKTRTGRTQRTHPPPKLFSYIARSVWTGTKLSHCPPILLFGWG